MHGEAAEWSTDTHLLALLADIGAISIWQPTEAAQKGRNKPVPLPRPGDTVTVAERPAGRSIEETRALLDAAMTPTPKSKPKRRAKGR